MKPPTTRIKLDELPALRGLSPRQRAGLAKALLVSSMKPGYVLSLEGRRSDFAMIILDGAVRAHRGIGQRTRTEWGSGTSLGFWKRKGNVAPASFVVSRAGRTLTAPLAVIEELGLEKRYAASAPAPRATDFVAARAPADDLLILNELLGRRRFARALDLGAGRGGLSKLLHRCADHVTLLDPDRDALREARRVLTLVDGRGWFDCRVGDARRLRFADGAFDLVATRLAVHHVPDIDRMLAEVRRVLRPGGLFLSSDIVTPARTQEIVDRLERLIDPHHHHVRSIDDWRAALDRAGFEVERQEITRKRATIDNRPYGAAAAAKCRKLLEGASPKLRRTLGVFADPDGVIGWVDHRFVLRARA